MRNTQNLQTAHLTRFGNPLNPNGVLYIASDQESLFEMEVDLILAKQSLFGQNVTLFDKVKIEEDIRRKQYTFNKKVSNEGIPKNVDFLLKQRKKSDTLKYCKKILITEFDLFILIHNCHRLKYEHKSKFLQYVPNHLVIKDEDTGKMKAGNALPFGKKVKSILKERRNINVHFFERETEWHCFFFSYEDIQPGVVNHWKSGCHLHYVSYLWPNYSAEMIWNSFDIRKTDISGTEHIHFVPYLYNQVEGVDEHPGRFANSRPLNSFVYESFLENRIGNISHPVAEVTTRGRFVIKASLPVM